MARRCYELCLDGTVYKLRLTLKGQKALMERSPGSPALACVMGAIDDAEDLVALLTEALNWEGNENPIHDGEELYDLLVDNGYAGNAAFMDLVFSIAHNAGLISWDEMNKLQRATGVMLQRNIDSLVESMVEPAAQTAEPAGTGEDAGDPLAAQTLDG